MISSQIHANNSMNQKIDTRMFPSDAAAFPCFGGRARRNDRARCEGSPGRGGDASSATGGPGATLEPGACPGLLLGPTLG